MALIKDNLDNLRKSLNPNIQIIAVSKYRDLSEILELYHCGQRKFAENRVQALLDRRNNLPADIEWHLIGHLQTNKVKYIVPFISMIHSVDSWKLLCEINKAAEKINRVVDCLFQVHVAMEESKFGFDEQELYTMLNTQPWSLLKHVRICGIMAMASNTRDISQINREFSTVHQIFNTVKSGWFSGNPEFCELSIGMSSDYLIAATHGSTMVRVGSALFETNQ